MKKGDRHGQQNIDNTENRKETTVEEELWQSPGGLLRFLVGGDLLKVARLSIGRRTFGFGLREVFDFVGHTLFYCSGPQSFSHVSV
jgi:hypothetical protein